VEYSRFSCTESSGVKSRVQQTLLYSVSWRRGSSTADAAVLCHLANTNEQADSGVQDGLSCTQSFCAKGRVIASRVEYSSLCCTQVIGRRGRVQQTLLYPVSWRRGSSTAAAAVLGHLANTDEQADYCVQDGLSCTQSYCAKGRVQQTPMYPVTSRRGSSTADAAVL
jgi:hypothetical protein